MFRHLLLFITAVIITAGCNNKKNPDIPDNAINPSVIDNPSTGSSTVKTKKKIPVLKFENDEHNFGTIAQGEKISFSFPFKNVGEGDLVIRAAQGSCGCTVPEYPKDPVKPGGSGIINVTFNSEGKEGEQHKTVTVISNTMPNTYVLNITGNVEKPASH